MIIVDQAGLPAGTHSTILTGRDVVTGEMLAYPVVWADRAYDACPNCGQGVEVVVEQCPVLLNTGAGQGGQIEERSQQHGCGEWLAVAWQQLPDDASAEDILAAAHELKGS